MMWAYLRANRVRMVRIDAREAENEASGMRPSAVGATEIRRGVRPLRISAIGLAIMAMALPALSGCSAQPASVTAARASASAKATPVAPPPGRLLFRRFADDDSPGHGLFTVSTDGTGEKPLTKPPSNANDEDYAWSPDGSKVVFTRHAGADLNGESEQVDVVSSDGSALRALTPGRAVTTLTVAKLGFDSHGSFSPDGQRIAYVHEDGDFNGTDLQHSNVWVMDASGHGKKQITHLPSHGGDVGSVIWSPDGTQLLYAFTDTTTNAQALFLTGADGGATRQLTRWSLNAGGVPAWSAKADLIAFRAVIDEDSGVGNIYTMKPDGSAVRQVTHLGGLKVSHVVGFSPDGQWLSSSSGPADGTQDMFLVKTDGTQFRYIDRTPLEESGPAWTATH